MPYPLPGTALYERVKDRITREWRLDESQPVNRVLIYDGDFSKVKMWFGLLKGHTQFAMMSRLGKLGPLFLTLFEKPTDALFRLLK
jgi:hypothetical protein